MALPKRTTGRRPICILVASAVAFATLAAAITEASAQSSGPGTITAFLLDRGRYTTIKALGARVELATFGINNRGEIVGEYIVDASKESGFVRDRRGRFARFDVPGEGARRRQD